MPHTDKQRSSCEVPQPTTPCVYLSGILNNVYFKQIIASSSGSITSTILLNPITVTKVKMQNLDVVSSPSVATAVRSIYQSKGVAGFFMGVPVGLLMSVPNTVLYMGAYEEIKKYLKTNASPTTQVIAPAVAGFSARLFAVSIMSPLELIRTLQTGGVKRSLGQIYGNIIAKHGIKGLYRGWGPNVMRDCPFSAMYWFGFEAVRPVVDACMQIRYAEATPANKITSFAGSSSPSAAPGPVAGDTYSSLATFVSGAMAGALAAIVTHPFDVLKTTLQMRSYSESDSSAVGKVDVIPKTSGNNSSNVTSLRTLYQYNGVRGMYRGLIPRLATVIPAGAIMVTIYEALKSVDLDALLLPQELCGCD